MRSITASRRPSAAFVLAIVALFVALGGTGYAAVTINGKEIQKRSIPGNRIAPNALGSGQVNESKLGVVPQSDHANTADAAANATNAATAQIAVDAQALQGRDASKFLASSVRVVSAEVSVVTGASDAVTASCAATEKGIGGGAAWIIPGTESPTELDAQLNSSLPVPTTGGTDNMTGWRAVGINRTGLSRLLRAYVVCVPKTA